MNNELLKAAVLGLVQGVTEFLPISSSGHLVVAQSILNFDIPGVLFEVVLHLGTVLAVVIYYKNYLLKIKLSEIKLYIYATIPVVIAGFLFKDALEALFDSTKLVGIMFLVTAWINYQIDKLQGRKQVVDGVDAWSVGFAQIFALIPGISRSGSTILAGGKLKIEPEVAARFSLVMSIPAILGANVLQIYSYGLSTTTSLSVFVIGFVFALLSGILSIKLLITLIKDKKLKYFSAYLILAGLFAIFII